MVKGSFEVFSEAVDALMREKGINNEALSKEAQVSISTIRKIRLKEVNCTIGTADIIANALGTTLIDILKKRKG